MNYNIQIKLLAILAILLAFVACRGIVKQNRLKQNLGQLQAKYEQLLNAPKDTIRLVEIDTITEVKPIYISKVELQVDSIYIVDTIKDIEVAVPREEVTYKTDDYKAVISGYQPRLDSMQIYQRTITEVVTKHIEHTKYKRFGIGVGVGASYDGKKVRPAITAGVQYNLLSF